MFRHRPTRLSSSHQLIALLFALVLAAAACSGAPEVEADDASAPIESEDGDAEDDGAEIDEADDVAVEAETETDAMGEDDAMVEDEVGTTIESEDSEATTGTTSAASTLDSAELAAALEAGTSDRFSLPFMYLTVDQDCDGCAETMSLYYVPGEEKASILMLSGAFIDGVAQSDFSAVDPVLQAGDPRRVAEQLAGTDAAYRIDPVSGAITSWTLGGNTVTLRCLQVDTRPIDMRAELCENSVIG